MILSLFEIFGHLHPLLVHLPIGILLLAALFYWMSRKEKYAFLKPATRFIFFWGMVGAIISVISGYLLSAEGDYEKGLVTTHQWFGIAVAFISVLTWLLYGKSNKILKWLVPGMVILIFVTGHLGGSLTHGTDYLTGFFTGNREQVTEFKPIPDVQEALVYQDIIQPLIESRCYTCHDNRRKKGGLRLDKPEMILKGGKDGVVLMPGNAEESDMIHRLQLPRNDDDHMPPKEKPQLKEDEIALIHWWVSTGASFEKKVKDLEHPEKIKPVLLALQNREKKISIPDVPEEPVAAADEKDIHALRHRGIVVVPVSANSNYLSVNFITTDTVTRRDLELLQAVKKQIVWLKIENKKIPEKGFNIIGQLSRLTRLHLTNTNIADSDLEELTGLKKLQYLNLVGTSVSGKGLQVLQSLTDLQALYLYKTLVASSDWQDLKKIFPKVVLDSGGYKVPVLPTDTTVVKPPENNQ